MTYRTFLRGAVAAIALAALFVPAGAGAEEMTLDKVLEQHLEARGGAEKIAATKSVKMTGTMGMGPGAEAPFTMTWKHPDKFRVEFQIQGQTGIQAYDGETAWMHMPFMGQAAPEKMPEGQSEQAAEQADFIGPLVDHEEKGNQLEYMGVEDVEGTEAYKVKVTNKKGQVSYHFLDTENCLEFRQTAERENQGQMMQLEMTYGQFQEVGGLILPHSVEVKAAGMPAAQVMTIKEVDVNVDAPDSLFAMPAVEAESTESEG